MIKYNFLAHSGNINTLPQTYKNHIENVLNHVGNSLLSIKSYVKKELFYFIQDCVIPAAEKHDLGKLDDQAQDFLYDPVDKKMINHVDAGVASKLNEYDKTKNIANLVSAFLIQAHHIGLQNWSEIFKKNCDPFSNEKFNIIYEKIRDNKSLLSKYNIEEEGTVKNRVDKSIDKLEKIHKNEIDNDYKIKNSYFDFDALDLRMMISILVDADHSDTTYNYKKINYENENKIKAEERLKKLINKNAIG